LSKLRSLKEEKKEVVKEVKSCVPGRKLTKQSPAMKLLLLTKLSGTLTGQTIDLSQFNKPKRKKED
jgi:translation initiation factor IF-2